MEFDWAKMWSDLQAITSWLFNGSDGQLSKIIFLVLTNGFLTVGLAIWVVKKVSRLFDYIVH